MKPCHRTLLSQSLRILGIGVAVSALACGKTEQQITEEEARSTAPATEPAAVELTPEVLPTERKATDPPAPQPLITAFEREGRDATRSGSFEVLVREAAVAVRDEGTLQSVECRATVCKLVVSGLRHDTFGWYRKLRERLPQRSGYTEFSGDMETGVIYMAREGYGRPLDDGTPQPSGARFIPPPEE